MSRLHLTQDQIDTLDRDTLNMVHDELNDELALLADVEKALYYRRRTLDVEESPELLHEVETKYHTQKPQPQQATQTTDPNTIAKLLKAAAEKGIDLNQFIK